MSDTRPSWADRIGYHVFVPPGHGIYVFPLTADDAEDA